MRICECGSGRTVWAKGVCRNCYNRKWRKDNPERAGATDRRHCLRVKYKMTEEEYETRLAEQGGVR